MFCEVWNINYFSDLLVEKLDLVQKLKQSLFVSERNEKEALEKMKEYEKVYAEKQVKLNEELKLIQLQKQSLAQNREDSEKSKVFCKFHQ